MSNRIFQIIFVVLLVGIDQASKFAATAYLPFQQDVDIVPLFALYLTHNYGIAFSMLSWLGPKGLSIMTVIITLFLLYLWRSTAHGRFFAHLGFALIISGALGNLIDRTVWGYVIDYFRFHTDTWSFAVFNVADSYISVGAACIILDEILAFKNPPKTAEQDEVQQSDNNS